MRVGLVLGAGGIQGGAWLTGGLSALATETGWDPMEATRIVGTSAGSMIGSIVAAGTPVWFMVAHSAGETIEGLTDAQGRPASDADRSAGATFRLAKAWPPVGPGSWGLAVRTSREPFKYPPATVAAGWLPRGFISTEPLKDIVRRASGEGWSPHPGMRVVACDYATGRRTVFGRPSLPKAELADAVAASCAIPGFYHPVSIGDRRYVDGGMYSTSNLDILRDAHMDLVICLNPTSSLHPTRAWNPLEWGARAVRGASGRRLGTEARTMRGRGTGVVLIQPVKEDLDSMGRNLMSRRNQHRTIEIAIETVKRQLNAPENVALLAQLPQAARPEKIHRPEGPATEWPSMRLEDLRPGSPLYEANGNGAQVADTA
ncbi:MAG: patatin-like phospholipase family protein [Actinomycetota bacterium]|nr:patatin-like phospholipase family protein [Actinomycetota bacterium]